MSFDIHLPTQALLLNHPSGFIGSAKLRGDVGDETRLQGAESRA